MAENLRQDSGQTSSTGGAAFGGGFLTPSRFAANPFARLATHKSDIDDEKIDRPIIAPATFTPIFGGLERSSDAGGEKASSADEKSISGNSFQLRPSALSSKTQNLGRGISGTTLNSLKSSTESVSEKLKPTENLPSSNSCLSHSQSEVKLKSDVKTDADAAFIDGNAATSTLSGHKTTTDCDSVTGFVFGKNLGDRVCGVPTISDGPKEADNPPPSTSSDLSSSGSGFVFGQNIAERVTGTPASPVTANDASTLKASLSPGSLQFSTNLPKSVKSEDLNTDVEGLENNLTSHDKTNSQSLAESASAYQAKHAMQEFDEVPIFTGEEDESNVLQINCKLYMFDKTAQNWLERGRGLLRLNDSSADSDEPFHSRIIVRTQGTLTVILNTKVWSGMMVERASLKSVRITGQCEEGMRVFLVMAGPKDIDNLFSAVDWRVQQLKMLDESLSSQKSLKRSVSENDDYFSVEPDMKKQKSDDAGGKKTSEGKSNSSLVAFDPKERREIQPDDSNDSTSNDPEVSNESVSSIQPNLENEPENTT